MPFLNEEQRKLVKEVLADVLNDADLTAQFNKVQQRRNAALASGMVNDHSDAMLGQYMGLLEEIAVERKARAENQAKNTPQNKPIVDMADRKKLSEKVRKHRIELENKK